MSNIFTYNDDPNFNGEKILIIDEDFLLADLIHYHFSKKGYGIDVCQSFDNTSQLDMTEYSMIIIDVNYNYEKSLALISDVRNDSLTEETPIVICSKMNNKKAIVSALDAGADDYITRPFAINELLIRLHKLLGLKLMPDTANQAS